MFKRKFLYLIVSSVLIIASIVTIYIAVRFSSMSQSDSVIEQAKLVRDSRLKERLSRPYGKIEIPAEVYVDLIQPENPRKAVEIIISASTAIPARSCRIILITTQAGAETQREEILWSDKPEGLVDKTLLYKAGSLPAGRHQYTAVLEFETEGDNSKMLIASGSLFLDVRPAGILSSNVSFGQIERLELYKELEKRVLVSMKPQLRNANSKVLDKEIIALESANPGIIDRKIQELIASDSIVAEQVEELNAAIEEPVQSSELITLSSLLQPDMNDVPVSGHYGSPVYDEQVPVPEEFLD
ncbi:MAG: hypothetical protein JW787_03915 [Sedimentisphaerales bacterium]|nr:hypothetical protein [Sedimentisphaerales bacterium]